MREKKRSSHTFHLTFAIQILQEYQRRSTEWEQQCIQYQKQLATMETQNKSLTDEISLMKVSGSFTDVWSKPKSWILEVFFKSFF